MDEINDILNRFAEVLTLNKLGEKEKGQILKLAEQWLMALTHDQQTPKEAQENVQSTILNRPIRERFDQYFTALFLIAAHSDLKAQVPETAK